MALGYFARALARAEPASAPPSTEMRPAEPLGSPLAEEDQRLHLDPGLAPGGEPATPSAEPPATDLPGPRVLPRAWQESGPAPHGADEAWPAAAGAEGHDPGSEPARPAPRREHAIPAPPPEASDPGARPVMAELDPPKRAAPQPPPEPQPAPARSASPAHPMEPVVRSVQAVERWIAAEPQAQDPPEPPAPPDPEPPPPAARPVPVLPEAWEARDAVPAPTVQIGTIEVEVVPPARAAPNQAPAPRPAPPPAAAQPRPFGWRQR